MAMRIGILGFGVALLVAGMPAHAQGAAEVVCSYAPSESKTVKAIVSAAGGAGAGVATIMQAAGLTAVAHSSGAYILTGSGGYIAGTIGGAAAAPVLVTGSIVVAGAALTVELICAPKNHPDSIKKIKDTLTAFERETSGKLDEVQALAVNKVRHWNDNAIDARDDTVGKIRAANNVAIEYRDSALGYFIK
jgi:hypothetical protein